MSEKTSTSVDVQFLDIQESYLPLKDITVRYRRSGEPSNSRDWIGLFRVGWNSNKDYHSYVWASSATQTELGHELEAAEVIFPASSLPAESEHFYQFCYVSREGVLRGASPPFLFAARVCAVVEEVVAGGDMESLVVVRLNEGKEGSGSSCPTEEALISFPPPEESVKAEEQLSMFETSVFNISSAAPELIQTENAQSQTGDAMLQSSQGQAGTEKQQQLQATVQEPGSRESHIQVTESDRRCSDLKVELEKERAKVKELTNQLRESQVTIGGLEQECRRQCTHLQSLLAEERAKVHSLTVQQQESSAKMVGLTHELGRAGREVEELKAGAELLRGQLRESEMKLSVKVKELEEVRMEVMYSQENISELVGALTGGDGGEHAHQQQQGGGRTHQQQGAPDESARSCPVCNKTFPGSQALQMFEQHVQNHFQD